MDDQVVQGGQVRHHRILFQLGSLHALDPAAQDGDDTSDLLDAFDFTQPPRPPLVLNTRSCFLQR